MGNDEKVFILESDLGAVTSIVNELILCSEKMFKDVNQMEVALYEAIYNAIEHGNLGIAFKKKEELIEGGEYENFIAKRMEMSPYSDRRVIVRSKMDAEKQVFTITDEGDGFNWRGEYERIDRDDFGLRVNGRGLKIMMYVFDKVYYNECGNEVCLVKMRDKSSSEI